jgi:hypothetical protein
VRTPPMSSSRSESAVSSRSEEGDRWGKGSEAEADANVYIVQDYFLKTSVVKNGSDV